MITVLRILKFILLLIIYIILLPLILLWLGIRYIIYRYNFYIGMKKAGLPNSEVRCFLCNIRRLKRLNGKEVSS